MGGASTYPTCPLGQAGPTRRRHAARQAGRQLAVPIPALRGRGRGTTRACWALPAAGAGRSRRPPTRLRRTEARADPWGHAAGRRESRRGRVATTVACPTSLPPAVEDEVEATDH